MTLDYTVINVVFFRERKDFSKTKCKSYTLSLIMMQKYNPSKYKANIS